MQKNAYVIDAYSRGSYHEVINQGFLMMISELYESVTYIAEKSSCDNLKQLLDACNFDYSNVTFQEKKISHPKIKWAGLNYLLWLIKVSILNYIFYIKSQKNTDIFYNNNLYFGCWLIKHFSFGKDNRIFDMCHSEMEMINPQKRNTSVMKLLGMYFDFSFKKSILPEKITFLLLSPKMVEHFNSWIKEENKKNIRWIDHCYIRPQTSTFSPHTESSNQIKVGIPGAISKQRGLPQLKEILSRLTENNVHIYATSFVSGIEDCSNFTCLNKTGKLLPFAEYNTFINQMDVLILFYDTDSYKLTASGAILEAIWNEKPILALKNSYFNYLFEKFGPLGKIYDNSQKLVEGLSNLKQDDLLKFRENLLNAKRKLYPYNVSADLKRVINERIP